MLLDFIRKSQTFPIGLLVFYFVCLMLTLANYVAYFRYNLGRYGQSLVEAYLAFVITGLVIYALFCGVCWVWAARYTQDPDERLTKVGYGLIAIFLAHDLPVLIMEYHAYLCCGGLYNGLQGTVFVVQWISFILSFIFAWQSYAWIGAQWLNNIWGDGMSEGLKTGQENLNILPPMPGSRSLSMPPLVRENSSRQSDFGREMSQPLLGRESVPTVIPYSESPHRPLREVSGQPSSDIRWARGNVPIEEPGYRGPSMDNDRYYSRDRVVPLSSMGSYSSPLDSERRERDRMYMPPPTRGNGTIYVERATF
jgi:hypothetical protein